MIVSRRNFLVTGQTLLAAAVLPRKFFGAVASSGFGSSEGANLDAFTKDTFLPLVNSTFAVGSDSTTKAYFTLLSVEDMNSETPMPDASVTVPPIQANTAPPMIDTFVLHFYATGDTLEQGTYELEHDTLGRFPLFVVPAGPSLYTAVISHLLNAAPIVAHQLFKPAVQASASVRPIVA
jgi:hypothetical protein